MKRWLPLLLPFAFCLLPSPARAGNYTTAVLNEPSLQSLWKFWESARTTSFEDSKGTRSGTPHNITFGGQGLLKDVEADKSASFNGTSSYGTVGDISVFNWEYKQAWSIECLCVPNVTRSGATVNYTVWSKLSANVGIDVALHWDVGTSKTTIQFYMAGAGGNYILLQTTTDIPNGAPVLLDVTYSGSGTASGVKIYLNANLQTNSVLSDTLAGHSILNGGSPQVGGDTATATYFSGTLETFSIYNTALSANSVASHYGASGYGGLIGSVATVAQTSSSVTVTWTNPYGNFDGSTVITPSATDVQGKPVGSWSASAVTPANTTNTASLTYTTPAAEGPVLLTYSNSGTFNSWWQYQEGMEGTGGASQTGTGQWALYVQKAAVPTRLVTAANGHNGYTANPQTDPAYCCPRIRDAWNGFVYAGSTINCSIDATPNLTRYELRDRKGNIVRSGSASGNLVTIATTGLANGAYELGLFSSTSNATWGDRHESLWVGIIPHTSHVYDAPPLCWSSSDIGWVEFGGKAIRTASEAPGNNSSGIWPYYVKRTGTITPTVTGNLYLRQVAQGSRRLTCNGTVFDDIFGATKNTGTYSNGVSIAVWSKTAYPICPAPQKCPQSLI